MWMSAAMRNRTLAELEPVGCFDLQGKGSDREGPNCYCQSARVDYTGGPTPPQGPDPQSGARNGAANAWRERAWQSAVNLLSLGRR